jgi:hypothetical protein
MIIGSSGDVLELRKYLRIEEISENLVVGWEIERMT